MSEKININTEEKALLVMLISNCAGRYKNICKDCVAHNDCERIYKKLRDIE